MLGMKIKGMERRNTCICLPDVLKGTSSEYPPCNRLSLVFIFVLSCWTKMVYITATLTVSHTILSSDFDVYFFFFQGDANLLCLLLSFTDEFTAVPRCSKHSLAGSLSPLCSSSTQDQRQPGSAPPRECRPVWQTAHVTG